MSFRQGKMRNRLSFKMMVIAILVTISLGIILSIVEIWNDWAQETKRIDQDSLQILETLRTSSSEVAYSLDRNLANEVIKGFLENTLFLNE